MQETFCLSVKSGCWVLVKIWLELAKQAEGQALVMCPDFKSDGSITPKNVFRQPEVKAIHFQLDLAICISYSTYIHIYIYTYTHTHTEFRIVFGAYKNTIDEFLLHLPMTFTKLLLSEIQTAPSRFLRFYILEKGNVTIVRDGKVACNPIPSQALWKGSTYFFWEVYEIGFSTYTI